MKAQEPQADADQLLRAWQDPVAGVTAYTGAITAVPLSGSGHQLVIADEDRALKARLCAMCSSSC